MKFVSKEIAIKLKEKGFDKPCFGFYNPIQDELQLYCANNKDVTYKNILTSVYKNKVLVDAPTIEQVLRWLRENKNTYITVVPEKVFDFTCYSLSIIQFNSPKHNFDTFRMNSFYDNINYTDDINYYEVCVIGIKYVVENLI